VTDAIDAAARVGAQYGYSTDEPVLLQETNNTVVWLRPHEVVAKVGTRSHSVEALKLEHAVAMAMAADVAPIAPPVAGAKPTIDPESRLLVTLWTRLEHDPDLEIATEDSAEVLRLLHEYLVRYSGPLPGFKEKLGRAREALADDRLMAALAATDRSMLRAAFDRWCDSVDSYEYAQQPLHGEPHDYNLLATSSGPRWVDLEGVCIGPLEWDLAFLPERADRFFPAVNVDLLSILRRLNSARVATWCWSRPEYAELRWHAEHHLEIVRRAVA
jgi:Phosphotransferase enzyme family